MQAEQIHDMTWEWTKKAKDELDKIAKEADKASKAVGPADVKGAAEMKAVRKRALDGISVVVKIFGKVAKSASTYTYER